jgi:acetylornithine deacetylase/succinyl-diaminopimelate desuccinylase-like protein
MRLRLPTYVPLAAAVLRASLGVASAQPATDPTAALLQELIRLDTSNPPGREGQIDDFLAAKLRPLGFDVIIVPTPDAGKSHMIARLKGDGSKRPVVLAAHADVVGVEREKWSVDPFAGLIRDGHVYGRGAIDFKGGMAVFARAVMQLAERKVALARDVIFVVEADEEAASYNTGWLAQTHWAQMDCEFALNEGGWIIAGDDGKVKYVSISTADKSGTNLIVSAKGTSTHSSMPRPDNAIFTLARALSKLAAYEAPIQLTAATKQFLAVLARTSPQPLAGYYQTLLTSTDAQAVAKADREISKDPLMHAIMRNTFAPTTMNGGFRTNVIPGSAEANINVRTIPGTELADLVKTVQHVIDDPAVTVRLANPAAVTSRIQPSSEETDLYRALVKQAKATFPNAEVTPYLFQAGTDAGAWRSRGVPVYGIYPYPITADELTRMHGNDERVSVESLKRGTEMIFNTLVDVAAVTAERR